MTSIIEVIQHYQRSIDNSQDNEARLLHCINKLYKLPIKVEHLQETGVGKTVNSLRKFNGEIGVAAKALVTKWKAMVAAEEEPMETSSQVTGNEANNESNSDGGKATQRNATDNGNHKRNNTSKQQEHSKHRSKENKEKHESESSNNGHKDKRRHSESLSSDHEISEKLSKNLNEIHNSSKTTHSREKNTNGSSSNHNISEREKKETDHKSSLDTNKDRSNDKERVENGKKHDEKYKSHKSHSSLLNGTSQKRSSQSKHVEKYHHSSSSKKKKSSEKYNRSTKDKEQKNDLTSSKDKIEHNSSSSSSILKSSIKEIDNAERKRRHNSDSDSIDFKSPQPKATKPHKSMSKSESSPTLKMSKEEAPCDSFDSSMGANFNDVLGMLNMPVKKSKKSLKSPTPIISRGNTNKKEAVPHTELTNSSSSTIKKLNGTHISSDSSATISKSNAMKLDLLAPSTKLEPLDPSIALDLPTISTNYKPMPLNQTVMDCVFNNCSTSAKPVRTLTDAEAISHGISSKTVRTKIYSGVRTGQTFQVPSLFDMCIRILQKNIDALEYTGGVPFEVLKPVLERATPQQLYVFEEYNPYLMEDSDVLWQQHVSRNYRTKKRIENESWREMFIRCQDEEERRLSVLKDSIKASQKIAAAPVRKTQLAFVDSMVKPPRNILKKQEQYGTKAKLVATPASRVASLSSVTPNAAKTGDQRLKVSSAVRDHAQVFSSTIRPKKAPLMQKTLQFIRGRHKR